jgi:hypothetical protein
LNSSRSQTSTLPGTALLEVRAQRGAPGAAVGDAGEVVGGRLALQLVQVGAELGRGRLRLGELVEQVVDHRRPGAQLAQREVRLRVARDVSGRHARDRVAELDAGDQRRGAGEQRRPAVVEGDGLRHVGVEAPGTDEPARGLGVVDPQALALQDGRGRVRRRPWRRSPP